MVLGDVVVAGILVFAGGKDSDWKGAHVTAPAGLTGLLAELDAEGSLPEA